jgi:hypothetical protein
LTNDVSSISDQNMTAFPASVDNAPGPVDMVDMMKLMGMETTGLNSATTTTTNSNGHTINMMNFPELLRLLVLELLLRIAVSRRHSSFIIIKAVLMIMADSKRPSS